MVGQAPSVRGSTHLRLASGWLAAAVFVVSALEPGQAQTPTTQPSADQTLMQTGTVELDAANRAALRYPQPVRVGTLIGRDLLQPKESQHVLGSIDSVVRHGNGSMDVIVRVDGRLAFGGIGSGWLRWQGFGTRLVSVPIEAVALLGVYLALMDLTPDGLTKLPTFDPASEPVIQPDEIIRVGIVKPFH